VTSSQEFKPDRWLVCGDRAYAEIVESAQGSAAEGLFNARLDLGHVEFATPSRVRTRLSELALQGAGTVYVVMSGLDESNAKFLLDAALLVTDRLEVRLCDLDADRVRLLESLEAPDQALQRFFISRAAHTEESGDAQLAQAHWWSRYLEALEYWEGAAREAYGDEFVEVYGSSSINWEAVAASCAQRGTHALQPPKSHSPHRIDETHTEDWSWTRFLLPALAAETLEEPFAPIRRGPPDSTAERWSLSRYPVLGERAVYLTFEAEADSIDRYVGCRIEVIAEGATYELGEVSSTGVAELRLDGTVDISGAEVRIGRHKRSV